MKRYIARNIIILCLPALFYSWSDCPAQKVKVRRAEEKIKSSKSLLEEIEGQIKATDARARGLKKEERSLVRQIHDIERQIDRSRQTLKGLNSEIDEINVELTFIGRELVGLAEKLELKKDILQRRLRGIYKRGRLQKVAVVLDSHSFTDFLKRIKYLTLIAAQDKRLVREVSLLKHTYGEYRLSAERKLALRIERKAELEREQLKLEQAEKQRQGLLKSVKGKRAETLKALKERRAEAERIKELIAAWERRRLEAIERAKREGRTLPPERAFLEGKRGSLIWPVSSKKIIRGFGPYVDKITRTKVISNGIDIKTDLGMDVFSVADGSVMFSDWFRSYGKTVMVDHGSGMYSSYTHLGDVLVEVGDFVSEGQTIARVGATGSLEGPILHFEIRDGARAINPLAWLGKK